MANLNIWLLGLLLVVSQVIAFKNCKEHFDSGSNSDGYYPIVVNGQNLTVFCSMSQQGGGWTRVFYHDYSNVRTRMFANVSQIDASVNNPQNAVLYSIMSMLPSLKYSNGPYEFMMQWPGSRYNLPQVWRQLSIGTGNDYIPYFYPINVPYQFNFIGLQVSMLQAPKNHLIRIKTIMLKFLFNFVQCCTNAASVCMIWCLSSFHN